jgi:outer membrane protein assembly factor BamB
VTESGALEAWNAAGCGSPTCAPLWWSNIGGGTSGVALGGGMVFAISKANGTLDAFPAGGCGSSSCSPAWTASGFSGGDFGNIVTAYGYVYATDPGAEFVNAYPLAGCGAASCSPSFQFDAGTGTVLGAIAVANRVAYIGTTSGLAAFPAVCAVGTVCSALWTNGDLPSATVLYANGVLYGSSGSTMFAVDATTGSELWTQTTDAPFVKPATVANGIVYFPVTFDNEVLAYGLPSS